MRANCSRSFICILNSLMLIQLRQHSVISNANYNNIVDGNVKGKRIVLIFSCDFFCLCVTNTILTNPLIDIKAKMRLITTYERDRA